MRTPGLSRPCGSGAFFAARSASANSGGRCLSYYGADAPTLRIDGMTVAGR
jgi:hypothetical protein